MKTAAIVEFCNSFCRHLNILLLIIKNRSVKMVTMQVAFLYTSIHSADFRVLYPEWTVICL